MALITPGANDLDPIAKSVVCLTVGDVTVIPTNNDNGDTLTLKVANETDATNITVQDVYTFAMGMFV